MLSSDGGTLYFTRKDQPGLWQKSVSGNSGAAMKILDDLDLTDWRNWDIRNGKVYYIRSDSLASEKSLVTFDLSSLNVVSVTKIDEPYKILNLTAQNDDSLIIYTQQRLGEAGFTLMRF